MWVLKIQLESKASLKCRYSRLAGKTSHRNLRGKLPRGEQTEVRSECDSGLLGAKDEDP